VLVPAAYEKAARLGTRLADGLEAIYTEARLPWRAHRLYGRSGWTFGPTLPRNAAEARALMDAELFALIQVYLANRGVWEAIASAGPCVSFAAEEADVAFYLDVMRGFVQELVA
jgi:glutamate-1-semialdehyde 2,1-aminomutase